MKCYAIYPRGSQHRLKECPMSKILNLSCYICYVCHYSDLCEGVMGHGSSEATGTVISFILADKWHGTDCSCPSPLLTCLSIVHSDWLVGYRENLIIFMKMSQIQGGELVCTAYFSQARGVSERYASTTMFHHFKGQVQLRLFSAIGLHDPCPPFIGWADLNSSGQPCTIFVSCL